MLAGWSSAMQAWAQLELCVNRISRMPQFPAPFSLYMAAPFSCQFSACAWENFISNMNRPKNFRVYFLLAGLAIGGLILLLREHRPSLLHPNLPASPCVHTGDDT